MINLFEKKVPIYLQLIDVFKQNIVKKEWASDEYIASVRDLALHYQVNPNTVFKALSELERMGLLINDRTVGKTVTSNQNLILKTKDDMLELAVSEFLETLKSLGLSSEEAIQALHHAKEKKHD
jgi:GntR family transcriptional regulator